MVILSLILCLTYKAPPIICSRRQFQILLIFFLSKITNKAWYLMLVDDPQERSYLIFRKLGKMSQNSSSAAVVIGALRVKYV